MLLPFFPQSKAKAHAKTKTKKKKDEKRGDSVDTNSRKNIRCKFHFTTAGCKNGKDCPWSHSKKTPERPNGGTRTRTPSPSVDLSKRVCYSFKNKGTCSRENCPFKHEAPGTPATPAPDAKAKAKAKSEPKAKAEPSVPAAKGKAKAKTKPAAPAIRLCRAWNPLAPAIHKRVHAGCRRRVRHGHRLTVMLTLIVSTDDEATWIGFCQPGSKSIDAYRFSSDTSFKSSNPRKSYKEQGGEVVKINMQRFVSDEKRATDIEFAKHKARLKAQMFKDMLEDGKDGDRIAHLRVPGTSRVVSIIFYDGEDDLMVKKLNVQESRKIIEQGTFKCMVQPVHIRKKIKFLMDTGCGHDLISQRKIQKHELETLVASEPISFQTANGVTESDLMSNFRTDSFDEPINAYVLDDTPSVLSVGKRCMNQEYGFVWPPGREPFMINPEGRKITLFVRGDIPYVRAGSNKSLAHDDAEASTIFQIFQDAKEGTLTDATSGTMATAVPGEVVADALDGEEHELPPDPDPDEVPGEDVPEAEAGRPPDPPEGAGVGGIPVDDDEREVEIEGEGLPARKAKVGTLKAEANTLAHLCTHRYRNPYCESCIRAKMKHYRTKRGAFQRELKAWGDLITFDFLDMRRAADAGVGIDDGAREILVVKDVATRMIAAIPTESRHTDQVVSALKRLIGRRKVKMGYSDVAPEFVAAMSELRIPLDHSLPGMPKNNSLAERTNQEIINPVATALLHAGLPAQYWPFALNCVVHNLNIEDVEGDGQSAWKSMTGEDFKGKAIPFGAKVYFKPTDTREKSYSHKFDPKGIPGIFAGYTITVGQGWSRKYRVWDMKEFTNANLSNDAAVPRRLAQPYQTEVVHLPEVITFPLKAEYEKMNETLAGLKDNAELGGKEINDIGNDDDDPPDDPGGGGGGGDLDDDDKPPPDPDEGPDLNDLSMSEAEGEGKEDISEKDAMDAIGDIILLRAEEDAEKGSGLPPLPPPAHPPDAPDAGRRPFYGVGPSGRLVPEGDDVDPGDIIKILKEKKLAPEDIEHWSKGSKGDGKVYLNDDGEACRIDRRGVPYKVGIDGRRSLPSRRPKHLYSPEEWKKLGESDKKAAYKKDKRDKARAAKKDRKRAAVVKKVMTSDLDRFCRPGSKSDEEMIHPKIVQCENVDLELNDYHNDDGWSWARGLSDAYAQEEFLKDVIPAVPAHVVSNDDWIPAMPCTTSIPHEHRVKNNGHKSCFNAMVTRPVTRKEMVNNPKAMEAFMKEWKGLWDQEVFDFSTTREYDDVVSEAKKKGAKVHMARVHGLIYEKNYQLKEDDPARKFKGRGVLLGDQVKDQNMEAALFQDLGNSPATFDASRWAGLLWMLTGQ